MNSHFTMLWSRDYCDFLSQNRVVGKPLQFIWGGYNAGTDFNHYKVSPNDFIYPIVIKKYELYLIARMKVHQCISLSTFQNLFPEQSTPIYHSCADQILIGIQGTPIRFDRSVPIKVVENLCYLSASGYRKPKYVEGGKISSISSFQGIYKLASESVYNFDILLEAGID